MKIYTPMQSFQLHALIQPFEIGAYERVQYRQYRTANTTNDRKPFRNNTKHLAWCQTQCVHLTIFSDCVAVVSMGWWFDSTNRTAQTNKHSRIHKHVVELCVIVSYLRGSHPFAKPCRLRLVLHLDSTSDSIVDICDGARSCVRIPVVRSKNVHDRLASERSPTLAHERTFAQFSVFVGHCASVPKWCSCGVC